MIVGVDVDDVNDNIPRFDEDNYTFSISEAAELRAFVGQVFAHDTDIGPNGEVHYSLNGSSFFSVDFSTGVLLVRESIRKRRSQTHRFQVKASDGGLVRRSVLVNISESKLTYPCFDAPIYDMTSRAPKGKVSLKSSAREVVRLKRWSYNRSDVSSPIFLVALTGSQATPCSGTATLDFSVDGELRTCLSRSTRIDAKTNTNSGHSTSNRIATSTRWRSSIAASSRTRFGSGATVNKRLDTPTAFAADFDPVASGGGTFIQTFRTGTTPPSRRREKTRSSTRVRSPNFSNAKRRATSSSSPRRRSKTSRRSRRPSTTRRASVRSIRSTLR